MSHQQQQNFNLSNKKCNSSNRCNDDHCQSCRPLDRELTRTIHQGKQCAAQCAQAATAKSCSSNAKCNDDHCTKCRVADKDVRNTIEHGKEIAAECAKAAIKKSDSLSKCDDDHCTSCRREENDLRSTLSQHKECANECAKAAKERCRNSELDNRAHGQGSCNRSCNKSELNEQRNLAEHDKTFEKARDQLSACGESRGLLPRALDSLEDTFHRAVFWLTRTEAIGDRSDEDKFLSYALWMQATHGDCLESKEKLEGQDLSRFNSWTSLKGMNRAEAMSRYIAHCAVVDANWIKDQVLESFPSTEEVKSKASHAVEVVKHTAQDTGAAVINKANALADSLLGPTDQQDLNNNNRSYNLNEQPNRAQQQASNETIYQPQHTMA